MSKSKKITFNMLAAGLPKTEKVSVMCCEHELLVSPTLTLKQFMQFVNDVTEVCVREEDGKFTPELIQYAIDCAVMVHYAGVEFPKDVEKAYRVINETDVLDKIKNVICFEQYENLMAAIDGKIKYMIDSMALESASGITKLVSKMDEVMSDNADLVKEMRSADFQSSLNDLTRVYSEIKAIEDDSSTESNEVVQIQRVITDG